LYSISKYYPELPIIVVDDSPINYKKLTLRKFPNLKIDYIVAQFDVGLSKGRNIALNNIKTEYFLLCDDDFEMNSETNLYQSLQLLIEHNVDILGGELTEVFPINSIYSIFRLIKAKKHTISRPQFLKSEIIERKLVRFPISIADYSFVRGVDFVNNFFLAKTSVIKSIGGWQPESMKLYEHGLFFLSASLNNLNVSYSDKLKSNSVRYNPIIYLLFRLRPIGKYISISKIFLDLVYQNHGIEVVETIDTKGISHFYKVGE
jgi:beta-1,4-N-acetylgalactosaminyltransferase 2